ncbi:DUF6338 family protein [Nocardioides mangrovi]|uniref:DUF6338 family protein n=1 Tax=Nocardioides mangrovi TaxID=2874580 RepID=A0ABS7U7V6_9ACTN|nr:DUF6338 family protein [Nocardioides mangrovi]MBZ5736925.1 DUF6338 family protein [Nocardioides mangrovi]
MLPSGLVAAAFLLSLIPGWWFLRRTESHRRPRQLSTLQEILELIGVGVLTTGLAACLGLLLWPSLVLDHEFPADTAREIRMDVALVLGTLAVATLLAEVGAQVIRRRHPADNSEINIGPWWSVMRRDKIPEGQLSYVALALADGTTVEGVLHNYTWSPDSTHRDVALTKPIKITQPGARSWLKRAEPVVTKTPYDYLLIPATEVKHVALKYTPQG